MGPAAYMLFRPEEVHLPSSTCPVSGAGAPRRVGMANYCGRICGEHLAVTYLDVDGPVAIEAGRVDAHRLTGKEPADRQRLEPSLGEPLLLAIDGNPMVGGNVGKGREGCDPIGIRVKPGRIAGGCYVVDNRPPLLHATPQLGSQLGVVKDHASLHHPPHDQVEGPVENLQVRCHVGTISNRCDCVNLDRQCILLT